MYYLGIDLGSYGLESVLLDEKGGRIWIDHALVGGEPIEALRGMAGRLLETYKVVEIGRVGVTGSGWRLAKSVLDAEYAGEELILLQEYCQRLYPELVSIVKIGYEEAAVCHLHQLPKRRGRQNECIRNLGALYQQQLERWQITPKEWNQLEEDTNSEELHISAKCPAFMLRDMVKYEQMGLPRALIASKMDEALVRCYLQNTAKDDIFAGEILFIGLLSNSAGAVRALEQETGQSVRAGNQYSYLAAEAAAAKVSQLPADGLKWRGMAILHDAYTYGFTHCEDGCGKHCALTQFKRDGQIHAVWGGKCDRWDNFIPEQDNAH